MRPACCVRIGVTCWGTATRSIIGRPELATDERVKVSAAYDDVAPVIGDPLPGFPVNH